MKRILAFCAIAGLVVFTGCSGDSRSPSPVPTPQTDTYEISVTATPETQQVGYSVLVTATVTVNGSQASDGTEVEFTAVVGGTFFPVLGGDAVASPAPVATVGGQASIQFVGSVETTYQVRARVYSALSIVNIPYGEPDVTSDLQVFLPLVPDIGTRFGNEQVVLFGKGIFAPVEVYFQVEGETHQAVTVSVEEDGTSATIRTPPITNILHEGEDLIEEFQAFVEVIRGVGTSYQQTAVYTDAFTFPIHDDYFPENLQVYLPMMPDEGDRWGGEEVVITGKGIIPPVEVFFSANTEEYQAQTLEVIPSVPPSATGTVRILTPPMYDIINVENPEDLAISWPADVRVSVGVNTNGPHEQQVIEEDAFLFLPAGQGIMPPEIYLLVPYYGDPRGGEMVSVLGRNFDYDASDPDTVTVEFICPGATLLGIEPAVSPDGHQVQVMTPQYSAQPLEQDAICDVRVTNIDAPIGIDPAFKNDAFVFLAEEPSPEITALSPTSGPVDGGTVVTIFGHGFDEPVQVTFMIGSVFLEAQLIEVSNDTGLSDNDTIICVSPDFSQQGVEPPAAATVQVCNVLTGKCSNTLVFQYGDALFISGNNPSEGQRGTEVIIYGAGFEDPLQVEFQGLSPALDLEEQAVSGTELVVRFPDWSPVTCEDSVGDFKVTLIERPQEEGVGWVQGGQFTYLGNTPSVISVDPSIVQETMGGAGVSPGSVTITGLRFCEDSMVAVNDFILDSTDIMWMDSHTIEVLALPAPNDFSIPDGFFAVTECTTDIGGPGVRYVPTSVEVSVRCIPGGEDCTGTLVGALTYEPEDQTCRAAPIMAITPVGCDGALPEFVPAQAPACSNTQTVTLTNNGDGDLVISGVTIVNNGPTGFTFTDSSTAMASFTVPPFTSANLDIMFCPTVDNGSLYTGTLVIAHNSGSPQPCAIELSGQEIPQAILLTNPYADQDPWNFNPTLIGDCTSGQLTISNDAAADGYLGNVTATVTGANPGEWTTTLSGTFPLAPGGSAILDVDYCPTAVGPHTATLQVSGESMNDTGSAAYGPAIGSPVTIYMSGDTQ